MEQIILNFVSEWGYIGIFIVIMLDNANIPLPPTEVILSLAGGLIAKDILNFWVVYIIATIAGVIGCLVFYFFILYTQDYSIPFLQKWLRISDEKLKWSTNAFTKYGGIALIFGRLIPGMRTISLIPAGLFSYPLGKFLFFTTVGTAIWNAILLVFGHIFTKLFL